MKLTHDEFDSSILNIPTYKLSLYVDDDVSEIKHKIKIVSKGLICCFVSVAMKYIQALEMLDFQLISIRNTYKKTEKQEEKNDLLSGYSIESINTSADLTNEIIRELVIPIYQKSRYCIDPLISRENGLFIYEQWLRNSLDNKYADQCFLARYKDKPIGICTAKIKDEIGYIDLLGVLPEYQHKHVGINLLQKTLQYMERKGYSSSRVITEGENIIANVFYQKNHFILEKVDLVYHKHIC